MSGVRLIGIDETSVKRGQNYITVVHEPLWQQACDALRGIGLFLDAAFDARDD